MNTVTPRPPQKKFRGTGKVGDLIGVNFDPGKTAFIGRCEEGEEGSLYLVTYTCISLAGKPMSTWMEVNSAIEVIRFVDVNISVVERN